jgi:hypothetical protein
MSFGNTSKQTMKRNTIVFIILVGAYKEPIGAVALWEELPVELMVLHDGSTVHLGHLPHVSQAQ